MIDHVKKGDPLVLSAEAYNAFADAANAYAGAGAGATLHGLRRGGAGAKLWVNAGGAVTAGAAVRITGAKSDLAAPDRMGAPQIIEGSLSWTAEQAAGDCVAIAAGSDPGGCVPAAVSGLALVALSVGDADHLFARPVAGTTAGEIESANAGPLRILAKSAATGADVWALCVVNQPIPVPENLYEIDRTTAYDDAKAWDPGQDLPADWADYDGVKLTTQLLRFNQAGDALETVKIVKSWPVALAPIIDAVETPEEVSATCDA